MGVGNEGPGWEAVSPGMWVGASATQGVVFAKPGTFVSSWVPCSRDSGSTVGAGHCDLGLVSPHAHTHCHNHARSHAHTHTDTHSNLILTCSHLTYGHTLFLTQAPTLMHGHTHTLTHTHLGTGHSRGQACLLAARGAFNAGSHYLACAVFCSVWGKEQSEGLIGYHSCRTGLCK